MKEIYEKISEIAAKDSGSTEILALKAVEELGELVVSLFHEIGYKRTDKNEEDVRDNQLEEGVDVIVCMIAILAKKGFTYKQIKKKAIKKTDKWNNIVQKRNIRINSKIN
jgi:hypothetical protein